MNRSLFVLALALILLTALAGEAIARTTPVGFKDPVKEDGDDHTWGGENNASSDSRGGGLSSSGVFVADILLRNFKFQKGGFAHDGYSLVIIGIFEIPVRDANHDKSKVVHTNRGN